MGLKKPKISVLLVNYKQGGDLARVTKSLQKYFGDLAEYLVFNNSSEKLNIKGVSLYSKQRNIGYAAAINYLSRKSKGKYLLVLNPDNEILVDPKNALHELIENPKYKIISLSKTNNVLYKIPFFSKFIKTEKRFSSCAFIIEKSVFQELGGFDEHFFMYFDDDDLAIRLKKAGIKTMQPKTEYIKHKKTYKNESTLKRKFLYSKSQLYFLYKNNFLVFLCFFHLIFLRILVLMLILNLDKILFLFFGLSLVGGLYPNALGIVGGLNVPLTVLDAAMLGIFTRSLFLKNRNKKFDYFLFLFLAINFTLLFFNYFLYLFSPTSVLYLGRFFLYLYSYPFFTKLFLVSKEFISRVTTILIPFSVILNLGIFTIFRNLEIIGFDPHKGRLYGQFLDPNFYGIFLLILLVIYLGIIKHYKLSIWTTYFTTSFMLLSVFLTFSRLSVLMSIILIFTLFLKYKNENFLLFIFGGVLLIFTNYDYLIRLLFVEGNFQSFILRVQNLFEGLFIYNQNIIPSGFNNIYVYNYYLNSTISNATTYFSFFPNNLVVTMGIFGSLFLFSAVFWFYINRISFLSSRLPAQAGFFFLVFFLLFFSSFFINVFFNTFSLAIICVLLGLVNFDLKKKFNKIL
ncbi:hypothetical protein KA001_03405 [Patescibacteria group bacterium]|nr:hypothetical protein [Patescibacteria group bacterium]